MTVETVTAIKELDRLAREEIHRNGPFTTAELSDKLIDEHGELVDTALLDARHKFLRMFIRDIVRNERLRPSLAASDLGERTRILGLMTQSYRVEDGTYKPLGDFEGSDAHYVATQRRQVAEVYDQEADAFERIHEGLEDGQRVRDVFTEEDLETIFREAADGSL